jgi:hypothetical protein
VERLPQAEQAGISRLTLSTADLCGLTAWSLGDTAPDAEGRLKTQLSPDRPLVVGRQEGGQTPYLDPRYRPTRLAPGSSRSVLCGDRKADRRVSRGHFMLAYHDRGVVLTNGVPRRGGGLRPPLNGTWLLEPERRFLGQGESYLIERGGSATISLPNGATVLISAD